MTKLAKIADLKIISRTSVMDYRGNVWAEQYDRDLNDLFAIQSEIAQKVAQRLKLKSYRPKN